MARSGKAPDRGSASVLALAILAVIVMTAGIAVALSHVAHARGQAQGAADLAAIAAAQALHDPRIIADPCQRARQVVEANGAALESCDVQGRDVRVVASVVVRGLDGSEWWAGLRASARALAGPAPPL